MDIFQACKVKTVKFHKMEEFSSDKAKCEFEKSYF